MQRVWMTAVVALAAAGLVNPLHAGWHEFWHRSKVDFHRNQCWPEPFVFPDREAQRAPFAIMVRNGWRAHNTLGDHLFDAETNRLTHAGVIKLKWIATQAPEPHQAVFVLQADSPQATSVRMGSVQEALVAMMPEGQGPPVMLTNTPPASGSGAYFDQVSRGLRSSVPAPRLPNMVEEQ